MVILVEVDARCSWPGRVVTVSSDDAVDGAEAETLLTTDDTIERSTAMHVSCRVYTQLIRHRRTLHLLFSCKASSLGPTDVFSSKSA